MSEEKSRGDTGFKVVDKRRFSEQGDALGEESEEKTKENAAAQAETTSESSDADTGTEQEQVKVDFPSFVVSLATQALVMLGEIPNPDGSSINENVPAAKQTIDILAMLQEKTKGNLSSDEEQLLGDVLANLQIAFVQRVQKK